MRGAPKADGGISSAPKSNRVSWTFHGIHVFWLYPEGRACSGVFYSGACDSVYPRAEGGPRRERAVTGSGPRGSEAGWWAAGATVLSGQSSLCPVLLRQEPPARGDVCGMQQFPREGGDSLLPVIPFHVEKAPILPFPSEHPCGFSGVCQ